MSNRKFVPMSTGTGPDKHCGKHCENLAAQLTDQPENKSEEPLRRKLKENRHGLDKKQKAPHRGLQKSELLELRERQKQPDLYPSDG